MNYADKFLELNCATDVLEIARPVKELSKELSETWAILRLVKKVALADPKTVVNLLDLCSGNALLPLTAVHLFPNVLAMAVDKRVRERDWSKVRRFGYATGDLFDEDVERQLQSLKRPTIVTAIHSCGETALRVIELFKLCEHFTHLFLMPCCEGSQGALHFDMGLSHYQKWCLRLCIELMDVARVRCYRDNNILSPKNAIIVAERR